MPSSPALRCSPGREYRMETTHNRGCSLKSGFPLKARDDDLALFNDMQSRERDGFLLQPSDDFDDSISKLRYFSDYKLAITIPAQGEGSDLLNADGEKNDYDWLLTPPDTPLFPSLDDDEHQLVNLATRSRRRTRPIPISRSSTTEKTHRTSRSIASPHRLSPSPQSRNNVMQSRGGPSSAPNSSPSPVLWTITPSRRPSTPPNKPSTPAPRSSTPPLRRMSTGSSGQAFSSVRRGSSPVKASHGNSASPKLVGWQSNLPGFSSEVPPNLRTSLSDRPASHTRGFSPASRNGRDSSLNPGKPSMSPSGSRSSSSLRSRGRDCSSSHSKHSAASLAEDDVDSWHSAATRISVSSPARKNGVIVNNRATALPNKPFRTPSASSALKRSFDSALRHMDHRKNPQNMFRPLLSSVPATTFYDGKANSIHCPMFSKNSSLTTRSNASSEQGVSIAPDIDGSDQHQNDLIGDWEKMQDPDTQEVVFVFDKVDKMDEETGHEICSGKQRNGYEDGGMANKVKSKVFEEPNVDLGDAAAAVSESLGATDDHSAAECYRMMAACSRCGKHFHIMEVNRNADVCEECAEKDGHFSAVVSGATLSTQNGALKSVMSLGTNRLFSKLDIEMGVPKLPERNSSQFLLGQHERNFDQGPDCFVSSGLLQSAVDERKQQLSDWQPDSQQEVNATQSHRISKFQQSHHSVHPSQRVDGSEGIGISVLLQKSSSNKWSVVQGRAFSATNLLCLEPSFLRDDTSAMKHSIGRDSASASSSIDLRSSRLIEDHVQQQLSSQKGEIDDSRSDSNAKSQSTPLSISGVTTDSYEVLVYRKSEDKRNFDSSFGCLECDLGEKMLVTEGQNANSGCTELGDKQSSVKQAVLVGDTSRADNCMEIDASASQLLSHPQRSNLHDASMTDYRDGEARVSCGNAKDLYDNNRNFPDIEVTVSGLESSIIEEVQMLNGSTCRIDNYDVATHSSSVVLGLENKNFSYRDSQTEITASQDMNDMEASHEYSVSTKSDKDVLVCALESNIVDHAHGIHEKSTMVAFEGPRGHMSRSLTLEEATDTVLFCSSIIHDLVYIAATIGMEKEELVLPEPPRRTVTILGKSGSDHKDSQKMFSSKCAPKAQKAKRKRLEADMISPVLELENNVKLQEPNPSESKIPIQVDDAKPPKLESKCNCTVM